MASEAVACNTCTEYLSTEKPVSQPKSRETTSQPDNRILRTSLRRAKAAPITVNCIYR